MVQRGMFKGMFKGTRKQSRMLGMRAQRSMAVQRMESGQGRSRCRVLGSGLEMN